jgi:hypothetical protein
MLQLLAAAGDDAVMTRISVSLDDILADQVKEVAGGDGKVSTWIAGVVRQRLVADACAAAAEYDRLHDDAAWEAERLAGRA